VWPARSVSLPSTVLLCHGRRWHAGVRLIRALPFRPMSSMSCFNGSSFRGPPCGLSLSFPLLFLLAGLPTAIVSSRCHSTLGGLASGCRSLMVALLLSKLAVLLFAVSDFLLLWNAGPSRLLFLLVGRRQASVSVYVAISASGLPSMIAAHCARGGSNDSPFPSQLVLGSARRPRRYAPF